MMSEKDTQPPQSLSINSGNPVAKSGGYLSVLKHLRWEQLVAGLSGGVVSTLVLHPLDLVKVRFQVNEGCSVAGAAQRPLYTGLVNALSSIARQQGFRGLYQGVTPNVWGAGASWGLYFFWYEALKTRSRNGVVNTQLDAPQHMWCAAQAGFFTLLFTNPIWVAKTRLCLQYDAVSTSSSSSTLLHNPAHSHLSGPSDRVSISTKQYHGMFDCLYKTYRFEGIRGLYKGFVPGVFGVSHGALQFMAYEDLKIRYNTYRHVPINTKFNTAEYLCFAALSKIFAATATYPYQVVRARLQDQHRRYDGAIDVIRQTYRNEGVRGFFKGIVPGVLRVTPACCITFVVYEKTVATLLQHSSTRQNLRTTPDSDCTASNASVSSSSSILAAQINPKSGRSDNS